MNKKTSIATTLFLLAVLLLTGVCITARKRRPRNGQF